MATKIIVLNETTHDQTSNLNLSNTIKFTSSEVVNNGDYDSLYLTGISLDVINKLIDDDETLFNYGGVNPPDQP